MAKPDNYLDCRGKLCPLPVIEARQAIEDMTEGSLVVVVDNLAARENVAHAMLEAGHEVLVEDQGGEWVLTVTKANDEPLAALEEAASRAEPGPAVILILDRGLGRSDPDLGRVLMKAFLTTLSSSADLPSTIVLMQGGVRLACDGSDCLFSLRNLQSLGVRVLACGTCLDYFGLLDKLRVGRVSNMAEIAELLIGAAKVVTL